VGCQEYETRILYLFNRFGQGELAHDVFLEFSMGYEGQVYYRINDELGANELGEVSDSVRRMFKKISMNSEELDKVSRLFSQKPFLSMA
jgi:hypothetical protein